MVGIDPVHLEQLPAPAVRRDAAAVHDRHGHAVHPGPGDHGRADLRTGRGGAALADGADQGAAAAARLRDHLRHPRHVPGQPLLRPADGDVRRAGGRVRRRPGRSSTRRSTRTAPGLLGGVPLHPRPAGPADRHPGQPAGPGPPPAGCRFAAALPARSWTSARPRRPRSTRSAAVQVRCLLHSPTRNEDPAPGSPAGGSAAGHRRRRGAVATEEGSSDGERHRGPTTAPAPLLRTEGLSKHFRIGGALSRQTAARGR